MRTSSSHPFHRGSADDDESGGRRAVATIVVAIVGVLLGCGGSRDTPAAPSHLPLAVYSIEPGDGPPRGGNQVAVFGTGFQEGLTITFDGVAATKVFILDTRTFTAVVPAHPTGAVDVMVSGPDGQVGKLTGRYQYWDTLGACSGCWGYDRTSAARRRP
jgi:IPT/TIG domain-containing protein